MATIDDLNAFQLELVIPALQGVVSELPADHGDAIVEEVEILAPAIVHQSIVNGRVHPVTVHTQITADVPLQQLITMPIE